MPDILSGKQRAQVRAPGALPSSGVWFSVSGHFIDTGHRAQKSRVQPKDGVLSRCSLIYPVSSFTSYSQLLSLTHTKLPDPQSRGTLCSFGLQVCVSPPPALCFCGAQHFPFLCQPQDRFPQVKHACLSVGVTECLSDEMKKRRHRTGG